MMHILINLILIQIIVVNLIDLSGFIDSLKKFLWKKYIKKGDYHNLNLKPISCSYCMTHHVSVIYLLIVGEFSLVTYAAVLILCLMTPLVGDFLLWLKDAFTSILNLLYKLLGK